MTLLTADLLRALRGAGYHVSLNEDHLRIMPPASGMSPALRDRIAEHRDALKALLRSDDPFADCTPCDPLILRWEARRYPRAHHAALVAKYLDRFAKTRDGVQVESAAWFAAVLDTHKRLASGEDFDDVPLPVDPAEDFELPADYWTEENGPAVYVCLGCDKPRARSGEPCPACGATAGRWFRPSEEDAVMPMLLITCTKCGREYAPTPRDLLTGGWRVCPPCRSTPPSAKADTLPEARPLVTTRYAIVSVHPHHDPTGDRP